MNNTVDVHKSKEKNNKIIDSKGRMWRTAKEKIEQLVDLMNEQSIHPIQTSDELFHIFDAVMNPEEISFLIKMGGGNHTLESLMKQIGLPKEDILQIINPLVNKGIIVIIKDNFGQSMYHIMTIFPGWFELYLMRGIKNEESKLFAKRVEELFEAAYKFGNEEVINQLMRDVGPHIKVLSAVAPKTTVIDVSHQIEPFENSIFTTKSIMNIFQQLDESEIITVGHCFCRFEKALIQESCRVGLPLETCISIGPAAEFLLKQGIAKQITKNEAITRLKEWQDKGCVHQATRTIPLKDFQAKYPIDIFCNCCWDCCGIIGNYNRGYLPYILKSYNRSKIVKRENCTGCGLCVEFCPVGAVILDLNLKITLRDDLCIGCGQCNHHCSNNVFEIIQDEREIFLPMLDKTHARIKPKEDEKNDKDKEIIEIQQCDKKEVLIVLEETRKKMMDEEISKAFRNWNKTMLYHFTDINEYWHFIIKDGIPGPLKEGQIDNPDIFYILPGAVFIGLMRGEIDGFKAFRKKLVKVKAPVKDLIKLQKLID